MKFSKPSQLFLVSSIGLLVATLLTACSITTIDYVFVASSSGIETFAADSESGALRTGTGTVTTDVSSPVAMAVTADYANLYVANKGNNTIVHYVIGLHGELTVSGTPLALSSTPVALATNTAGTYLYVVASGTTATLTEYALSSGAIGSQVAQQTLSLSSYANDTIIPTGIAVLVNTATVPGSSVYVTAYDKSAYNPGCTPTATCAASTANPGWVFGYTIGTSGALSATTSSPYEAGIKPSAIAADPTNRFVYVTDYASNELIGYTIMNSNNLNYLTAGPFKTGNEPSAVAIDPRGKFIYVTNFLDSSVTAYAITQATGVPTVANTLTGSTGNATETEPVAVAVDPALGRFVYTVNYLADSVSGFRLDTTAGSISPTQATPYPTGSAPTALIVIPHGNHAVQAITQ
jgi:6-phosphogluconolactonase (cycloisomerase 2 family)